jgi:hypothetical protein
MAALLTALMIASLGTPARARMTYGDAELSGSVETQNLVRHPEPDTYQFVQNRNTLRLQLEWDWLKKGRFLNTFDIPFIERSKFFLLYRTYYDGFYDIAPGGRQIGEERFDDIVGGPLVGNTPGQCVGGPCTGKNAVQQGLYSRLSGHDRANAASDVTSDISLREVYVDFKLKDLPLSFRLGRQQVIWGESDQFRLMDIWNPLDTTWHVQQESWDNIRIPLWLGKALWDMGQVGPLSNAFAELVYNPGDFQNNAKLRFLPQPWAVPLVNPIRNGQLQYVDPLGYFSTNFNMQGTSMARGDFQRNPKDASEVGLRFHGVTPQGLEFSTNYLYARTRQVGANNPVAVHIDEVDLFPYNGAAFRGGLHRAGTFAFADGSAPVNVGTALVKAKTIFPYQHIFGFTANYFEGDYTSSVLRLETVYATDQPYQTVEPARLPPARVCTQTAAGTVTCGAPSGVATQGTDVRDTWAGMIGFDRPTWIRFLNDKATWFITGQVFWSYLPGNVSYLRGNSGADNSPYFTPVAGGPIPGSNSQGVGTWQSGPYGGLMERIQAGSCLAGANRNAVQCLGKSPDLGDAIHRWEHLVTLAATSFYRSGTIVPFIADAWDPVNDNNEVAYNIDYYYTNNFIIQFQQKFYMTYGSKAPSNDPWFVGGRLGRRDETGIKLTYQF